MSAFRASIGVITEHLRAILDHLGAMYATSNVSDVLTDRGPRYLDGDTAVPGSGTNPIVLEWLYDPEGQGKPHFNKEKGLPNDGTVGGGQGSIPNEGLPSDGTKTGSPNDYGFGFGEGA